MGSDPDFFTTKDTMDAKEAAPTSVPPGAVKWDGGRVLRAPCVLCGESTLSTFLSWRAPESHLQIAPRLGKIRLQPERLLKLTDRLVQRVL
jgi:hypothetical protein